MGSEEFLPVTPRAARRSPHRLRDEQPRDSLPSSDQGSDVTADRAPAKLIQGTVDLLILQALTRGPEHGYGVSVWLRAA